MYTPSPALQSALLQTLKKTKINQKQKAMKNMGVTIYSWWVAVSIPCSLYATAQKCRRNPGAWCSIIKHLCSCFALPCDTTSCGFCTQSVQWKRVLDSPALSEHQTMITFLHRNFCSLRRGQKQFECLTLSSLSLQKGFLKTMKMLLKYYQTGLEILRIRLCFWKKVINMLYLKIPR